MTRLLLLAGCLAAVWLTVLARAATLQVDREELRAAAVRQRMRATRLDPRPGSIVDRDGRLLATSRRVHSIYAVPNRIDDADDFAAIAGPLLSLDPESLAKRIEERSQRQFLWIARHIDDEATHAQLRASLPAGSWGHAAEWDRLYPQGAVAAHLLGFRGVDHEARAGIERGLDEVMTGVPGQRLSLRDVHGTPLARLDHVAEPATDGASVALTIDAALSAAVGHELELAMQRQAPLWAAAVVVDVRTAGILAIETRPNFDPNHPAGAVEAGVGHASRTAIEPGSTLKPFVVAAALEAGLATIDEQIDCGQGERLFGQRLVTDSHDVGAVPLGDVLVESSNIGAATIAERLGPDALHRTLSALRFGRDPASGVIDAGVGRLQSLDDWSGYSLISHAIGYEVTASPLQLARAYCTLATDGHDRPLRVLRDAAETPATAVLDESVCRWLRTQPLRQVVQRGTAAAAFDPEVDVWGKTGTARKFNPAEGAYDDDRVACVFAGGTPCETPRFVVAVVVDSPRRGGQSGGRVAAPIAVRALKAAVALERRETSKPSPEQPPMQP